MTCHHGTPAPTTTFPVDGVQCPTPFPCHTLTLCSPILIPQACFPPVLHLPLHLKYIMVRSLRHLHHVNLVFGVNHASSNGPQPQVEGKEKKDQGKECPVCRAHLGSRRAVKPVRRALIRGGGARRGVQGGAARGSARSGLEEGLRWLPAVARLSALTLRGTGLLRRWQPLTGIRLAFNHWWTAGSRV
jgi:hypothetical protein